MNMANYTGKSINMLMDLFETIIRLSGVPLKGSAAESFMAKLDTMTTRSPLDAHEYILDNCRIHCGPTDMNRGIRINDMQSMSKGSGSAALGKLCALADEFSVPLTLTAKGFSANPTPVKVLVNWYSRFGFVKTGGSMKEGYHMKREATAAPAPAESPVITLRGFNKRPH